MKNSFFKVAGVIAFAVGAIALSMTFNNAVHSTDKGADWLAEKGYTEITGGKSYSHFNTCWGEDDISRTYTAVNPDGQNVKQTVCFGLFGPYWPLSGGEKVLSPS